MDDRMANRMDVLDQPGLVRHLNDLLRSIRDDEWLSLVECIPRIPRVRTEGKQLLLRALISRAELAHVARERHAWLRVQGVLIRACYLRLEERHRAWESVHWTLGIPNPRKGIHAADLELAEALAGQRTRARRTLGRIGPRVLRAINA